MARAWKVEGIKPKGAFRTNGCNVIAARVREAIHYEPLARDPSDLQGLHNMRISVKRLRYSMELFLICFGKPFARCLAEIKALQELLGQVRDCDVLIAYLEQKLALASPDQAIGVDGLLQRTMDRRLAGHANLCDLLDRFRDQGVWDVITRAVCPRKGGP